MPVVWKLKASLRWVDHAAPSTDYHAGEVPPDWHNFQVPSFSWLHQSLVRHSKPTQWQSGTGAFGERGSGSLRQYPAVPPSSAEAQSTKGIVLRMRFNSRRRGQYISLANPDPRAVL
ncbi:hypothetical protein E4U28_001280 [Claviceps purpurea]|nr:hypothetical protein E4U28_001280 [Claviceps purpurea]